MRAALPLLILAWPCVALAQDEPGAPRANAVPAAAPDVVKLKNGGLVRGTISELVPGQAVSIITALGDVRRYPMSEVEYAGPATGITQSSASAGGSKKVALEAEGKEITFHRRTSSAVSSGAAVAVSAGSGLGVGVAPYRSSAATFMPLCLAPCAMGIAPGTYYLALSKEDGEPVADNHPLVVDESTTKIVGDYESRAGFRIAGFIVGGLGFIGAVGTTVGVLAHDLPSCDGASGCQISGKPLAIGLGISVGTMIIGYILSAQTDEVSFKTF